MTDNVDGLADLYYSKLRSATNPGIILLQFYQALTGKPYGRSEIIKMNMLVKVFGRTSSFFAIIDVCKKEAPADFPYGLLYKICRDRLESALGADTTLSSFDSLDRMITDKIKDISKTKKIDPDKFLKRYDRSGGDDDG